MESVRAFLPFINQDLIREIEAKSAIKEIPKDTEILRTGQYVKVVPIVLEGLVKVFSRFKDKELLLYYIQPKESCIMSFAAGLRNNPSNVFAKAEEDSKILLLPVDHINHWIQEYPDINTLFYQQYNLRYTELLETINHVVFDKMDKRLHDYLLEKKDKTNQNPIKISHRQIASELGTAREVISRVVKKLEMEGKVIQHTNSIEIIPSCD